jgi:hypothetical protein
MRVKISYGININEVPETVTGLLQGAVEELKTTVSLLEKTSENIDYCENKFLHVVEALEKVRKSMNDIDLTIADTQLILQGLENYYNGENDVSEGRSTMDSSGDITEKV